MRLPVLFLIAASAVFAAPPDFSGNWKLDPGKSEFGEFPKPSSMTVKVAHAEPKLTVDLKIAGEMGEFEFTSNYTTDGKECTNQGPGGSEIKSTVRWDGEALLIDSKGAFGETAYVAKEKWSLAEDRKTLTVLRHFSSSMGELDQKVVMQKE